WRSLGLSSASINAKNDIDIKQQIILTLAWLEQKDNHILVKNHPLYPALLKEIPDAPCLLFVTGNIDCLNNPQLAIVGSRHASRTGIDTAHRFAHDLATAGMTITSGLAIGIDGAAHKGALACKGTTIAVLGSGLQTIYPHSHRKLAESIIAEQGALVSEFSLNCSPRPSNFPRRNRIISGLSLGVLVIEAGLASGSLITARLAADQGREVYAVPGSIHLSTTRGCHQLIRDGATLVENAEHIFTELQGWSHHEVLSDTGSPVDTNHPLLALIVSEPRSNDTLVSMSGWSLPQILAELTEFELTGIVYCENGFWHLGKMG
ncbi:UNVERIFIED_CONTAM: hypothetical protein GTU68_035404, partial [Idotea baltica]|nr:hypothetical protein [Idotea baltica]